MRGIHSDCQHCSGGRMAWAARHYVVSRVCHHGVWLEVPQNEVVFCSWRWMPHPSMRTVAVAAGFALVILCLVTCPAATVPSGPGLQRRFIAIATLVATSGPNPSWHPSTYASLHFVSMHVLPRMGALGAVPPEVLRFGARAGISSHPSRSPPRAPAPGVTLSASQ